MLIEPSVYLKRMRCPAESERRRGRRVERNRFREHVALDNVYPMPTARVLSAFEEVASPQAGPCDGNDVNDIILGVPRNLQKLSSLIPNRQTLLKPASGSTAIRWVPRPAKKTLVED